jgi:hypothetical protein
MSHDIQRSQRRALAVLTAGITLALAMTVTQCRPVDDVVGVTFRGHATTGASDCIVACAHAYADSMRVESALHVTNVQACAGDEACLANEAARFEQVVERIQVARRACLDDCHHQGGGEGGR